MPYFDGHGNNRTDYVEELENKVRQYEKQAIPVSVNVKVTDLPEVKELLDKAQGTIDALTERAVRAEREVMRLHDEIAKKQKAAKPNASSIG